LMREGKYRLRFSKYRPYVRKGLHVRTPRSGMAVPVAFAPNLTRLIQRLAMLAACVLMKRRKATAVRPC